MEISSDNLFNCDVCEKKFRVKSSLTRHVKMNHSNIVKEKDFLCDVCSQTFNYKTSLDRHVRNKHPETTVASLHHQKFSNLNPVKCDWCIQTFYSKSGFIKHCKNKHPTANLHGSNSILALNEQFICTDCNSVFQRKAGLTSHIKRIHQRNKTLSKATHSCVICANFLCNTFNVLSTHYFNQHDIKIIKQVMMFLSMETFLQWKEEEEKRSLNKYVQRHSTKRYKNGCKFTTYYCHRSGVYKPTGKGLRHLKSQGSKKIGKICPSRIYVKFRVNGEILVNYIVTHVGHDSDLCHLTLTPDERAALATKISMRIPYEDILDEVRDSIKDTNLQRHHLVTRRDLINIEKSFNLTDLRGARHQDDATSVDSWAKENSSVVFYKSPAENFLNMHIDDLRDCDIALSNEKWIIESSKATDLLTSEHKDLFETKEIISNLTSQLMPEVGLQKREQFLKKKQEFTDEVVKMIDKHVNSEKHLHLARKFIKPFVPSMAAVKSNQTVFIQSGNNEPSNKNVCPQRLYKIKKSSIRSSGINKPIDEEQHNIAMELINFQKQEPAINI